MIRYFIINNASRASNYGVGTYTKQLISGLAANSNILISQIDMDAGVKEYSVSEDEDEYTHYSIPYINGFKYETICRNAFYFLAQHINREKNDTYVFHFNYYQHYELAVRLKAYLPCSKIIIAAHYFSWCFQINGNITKFKNHLSRNSLEQKEEQGYSYFTYDPKKQESENEYKQLIESYQAELKFMHFADSVVVLAEGTKKIVAEDYGISPNKIALIPNGLADTCKTVQTEEDECTTNQESHKNIVFVGRLDMIKGVKYLIRAFRKLYQEDKSLRLWLVGDGDFSTYLSESLETCEAVTFTGKTDKKFIEKLYEKTCVGVLPSFHEQCSYSAIEMMMHGIPLVGTDSTGLHEMLRYTPENIVHIDEETFDEEKFTDDLTQKIKKLLEDSEWHLKSSQLTRQAYLDFYTIEMMQKKYSELSNKLINDDTILPEDMMSILDNHMYSLINQRPEIDLNLFGMTGIGVYLWQRVKMHDCNTEKEFLSYSLIMQEYLIYYLDWVAEEFCKLTAKEKEMQDLKPLYSFISELYQRGFYKSAVRNIIKMLGIDPCKEYKSIPIEDIFANALRIHYDGE